MLEHGEHQSATLAYDDDVSGSIDSRPRRVNVFATCVEITSFYEYHVTSVHGLVFQDIKD